MLFKQAVIDNIRTMFEDDITCEKIEEPVMLKSGHILSRKGITEVVKKSSKNPMTREAMTVKDIPKKNFQLMSDLITFFGTSEENKPIKDINPIDEFIRIINKNQCGMPMPDFSKPVVVLMNNKGEFCLANKNETKKYPKNWTLYSENPVGIKKIVDEAGKGINLNQVATLTLMKDKVLATLDNKINQLEQDAKKAC